VRSSVQIDSVLFPTDTDVFRFLYTNKAWESEVSDANDILRTCALEVSLDYCQRVTTNVATELVEALEANGTLEKYSMEKLEEKVQDMTNEKEPFCKVLETCLANGMQGDECSPTKCPFQNEVVPISITSLSSERSAFEAPPSRIPPPLPWQLRARPLPSASLKV
jgi:hypothetical protein